MKKIVIGILAHVDSGKTTLSESLLFEAGAIKKMGRVDSRDAFLDNNEVERERGITIYSKNARFTVGDTEFILIDTPGHVDFSTEMERALSVLDVAILLVSGSSGVQPHTKTLWSLLKNYEIPTLIFVNKMDMEGTNPETLLSEIKTKLSSAAVDFSYIDDAERLEEIASNDEKLMEEYLDKESLDDALIKEAIRSRSIFPVFFGSALKMQGITELFDGLKRYMPSPVNGNPEDEFGAVVYKIRKDSSGKRETFLKITSGSLKVKDMLMDEKVNEIRIYSGENYKTVQEVSGGEICALAGISDSKNGMVYGCAKNTKAPVLSPAISYAVRYPKAIDRNVMFSILRELEEEDPSLNVEYNEDTKELFVSLMGDVQTEVLKRVLSDRYNIAADFTDGKVCYKETVSAMVEGVGHFEPLRHYAEAHIKIEPLERNAGIEYALDVSEDILSRNWQRLILTHLKEKEHRGVLLGAPLTDVKYTLVAGKAHLKHTEGGDFRQATYRAIRQGLMTLLTMNETLLLEPFYNYSLVLPTEYTGRAMTDISSMSGTVTISEADHEESITVLTGRAPVSTMNGYTKEVAAYSKGLGILTLVPGGYDVCHNTEEVLEKSTYNPDSDLRYPSGSLFCSHGAGTVIPWNEVPDYMHVPYSFERGDNLENGWREDYVRPNVSSSNRSDIAISLEEIESILRKSTHANEKGRTGSYKGISKDLRERRRYESVKLSSLKSAESDDLKNVNEESYNWKQNNSKVKIRDKYILVDGYNVIHAWKELEDIANVSLDGACGRLNDILCNYQAIEDVNLMVIYDAYKVKGHPVEEKLYNNITVVYTKEAQTADQYIERYTHENSKKYDITVITSDGLEKIIVTGNGSKVMSSGSFKEHLERIIIEFNSNFNVE